MTSNITIKLHQNANSPSLHDPYYAGCIVYIIIWLLADLYNQHWMLFALIY